MNERQKKIMVPYEEKTDTCPDWSNEGVIWTQSFEAVRVAEQQERIKKDAKRSLMRRLVCWNYIINIAKKLFNS